MEDNPPSFFFWEGGDEGKGPRMGSLVKQRDLPPSVFVLHLQ